jgi:hypothetical protein
MYALLSETCYLPCLSFPPCLDYCNAEGLHALILKSDIRNGIVFFNSYAVDISQDEKQTYKTMANKKGSPPYGRR